MKKKTYDCGHDSKPVIIGNNDITRTTRYFNWTQDKRNICFRCYEEKYRNDLTKEQEEFIDESLEVLNEEDESNE